MSTGTAKLLRSFLLGTALVLTGCALTSRNNSHPSGSAPSSELIAPGVIHRALSTGQDAGVDLIDVDLAHSSARPALVTGPIRNGMGRAITPEDWMRSRHALAASNGGYFGWEDSSGRKQVLGLLVRRGQVVCPSPPLAGSGGSGLAPSHYVRSAFGITPHGMPEITWAATDPSLTQFSSPLISHANHSDWSISNAVGCGPALIHDQHVDVTDRLERLASPSPLPRTFVAYNLRSGRPWHFVLGIASSMTFAQLAQFLQNYFVHYDHHPAQAAMCLDGGESSQLSYRLGRLTQSPLYTGVTVPDAVIIRP